MKSPKLVVKDNALINASYNLDLTEQRLILLAIVEAREKKLEVNANDSLTVHAESYMTQFDVHRNTAYQALKDACKKLFERRFSYEKLTQKGNVEKVLSRWVQEVSYVEDEALVRIKFSSAVVPLITNLERQFTSYELEQVSELSSAYAVRLYELLMGWRSTGKTPVFEINDFRGKMGIEEDEYALMRHFKSRVLDFSIKQINAHTDITAKYEQHKRGRSITGFSFTFTQKNAVKTLSKKPKREQITRKEAAEEARPGEEWHELVKRLSTQYHIKN